MNKNINVGLIGCQVWQPTSTTSENFLVKKILLTEKMDSVLTAYPEAEVVEDIHAIVDDSTIDLVIISPNHLHTVRQALEAGKSVRVMNYIAA